MAAIVAPSEEEAYLLAILDSPDGLDLAEFTWKDPTSDDGIFRAYDFQWPWYTCEDTYQVDQGGRALGKTVSITMRAFAFPFCYPGQQMLITAPELNHLAPLTGEIEKRLLSTRMSKELLPRNGKSNGISKAPHWQAKFVNDTLLVSRLPNRDGKGVKGQHVLQIELDEAQDYPLAGWIEIVETLNRGVPGAAWRCHGVPKGVRDKFFEMTEGSSEDEFRWTVHRPMGFMRPSWSDGERQEKIRTYGGSRQAIDYKRNIYGEHGDASNSVFVLARLMACVDTDEASEYNGNVYQNVRLTYEDIPNTEGMGEEEAEALRHMHFLRVLDFPQTLKTGWSMRKGNREVGAPKGFSAYYGGADIGVTNHPSEFLIFGQREGTDHLDLLVRIQLQRINTDDQKFVIEYLFAFFGSKLRAFALDKTGVGFPIWDQLSRHPQFGKRIYGYNFSGKYIVAFEDRPLEGKETQADLAIERNVVEASTDWLRNDYVDAKRITLPFDKEVLLEFQGQTYTVIKDSGNPYGTKRLFGGGSFHTLDAAKMAMAGKHIPPLEELLATTAQESVLDVFFL